jgi:hypothetical protein
MRLRPLTEAECYARCYGGHAAERVSIVYSTPKPIRRETGDELRELFEERLDTRPLGEEAAA